MDGPGAGKKNGTGTLLVGIDKPDATFGTYVGKNATVAQAFFRSKAGVITTFAPPNATFTIPLSIDNSGAIVGYYGAGNPTTHKTSENGFLRTP